MKLKYLMLVLLLLVVAAGMKLYLQHKLVKDIPTSWNVAFLSPFYAIYQDKTVNQVVEAVLREHNFHGAYFWDQTLQKYPTREIFCQWNETDLQFIQRLCSEVGIWYCFEMDTKLNREVIVFGDDSSKLVSGLTLPHVHPSNLNDNQSESIWHLSAIHKVVEASVTTKDYNYGDSKNPLLSTETVRTMIDTNEGQSVSGGEDITYGDAYYRL